MADNFSNNKSQYPSGGEAKDRKHPQSPTPRGGSKIGVPGGDKSAGHKKDSSYAVPHSHQMDNRSNAGSFPSQQPSVSRGSNQVNNQVPRQPLVPFDQNDLQDQMSGQSGTSQPSAGFGRLASQ